MLYGETSFAGKPMFGEPNPAPTHFQHIADWLDHQRLQRFKEQAHAIRLRHRPRMLRLV